MSRFSNNYVAMAALTAIILIFLIAIIGPPLYGVDPGYPNREFVGMPQAPAWQHPLGIDDGGRDVMARVLAGARISLAVGVISCLINLVIGVGIGMTAGWCHDSNNRLVAAVDTVLMRGVDILYSLPLLLVVILMQLFVKPVLDSMIGGRQNVPLIFSPDLVAIYLALGVTNWLTMARLARGEVINQTKLDYVMAARSLGQRNHWILLRHVLPNCLGPLTVAATLAIPEAIFVESFLAFVGLGVTAPQASWGTMAYDGLGYLSQAPWLLLAPAVAISVTMLAFNLFGDGLRDALDPASKA